jgi:hypothetical protein
MVKKVRLGIKKREQPERCCLVSKKVRFMVKRFRPKVRRGTKKTRFS